MKIKKLLGVATLCTMLCGIYGNVFATGEVTALKEKNFALFESKVEKNDGFKMTLEGEGKLANEIKWEYYRMEETDKEILPGMWEALVFSGEGAIGPFESEKAPWEQMIGKCPVTVYVQDGITSIEDNTFMIPEEYGSYGQYCVVYVPSSVESISDLAFSKTGRVAIEGVPKSEAERYASKNAISFAGLGDGFLQGDMDESGKYEAEDALSILKMVVGMEDMYKWSGDADQDENVTAEDALYVLKNVVGIE